MMSGRDFEQYKNCKTFCGVPCRHCTMYEGVVLDLWSCGEDTPYCLEDFQRYPNHMAHPCRRCFGDWKTMKAGELLNLKTTAIVGCLEHSIKPRYVEQVRIQQSTSGRRGCTIVWWANGVSNPAGAWECDAETLIEIWCPMGVSENKGDEVAEVSKIWNIGI